MKKNKSALGLLANFITEELPEFMREEWIPAMKRKESFSRELIEGLFENEN